MWRIGSSVALLIVVLCFMLYPMPRAEDKNTVRLSNDLFQPHQGPQIQIPYVKKENTIKLPEPKKVLVQKIEPFWSVPINEHAKVVVDAYKKIPETEWPYIRFITWYDTRPEDLNNLQSMMTWWLNHLSFSPSIGRPVAVTDRLWMVDLREFGWNEFAWEVVAERDPYMQMPFIRKEYGLAMQDYCNYQNSAKQAEQKRFPVIAMVKADWLLRETMETNRSPSYYDLLYAKFRFEGSVAGGKFVTPEKWRVETKKIYHSGGDYIYPDDTGRVLKNVKAGWYEADMKYKVPSTQIVEQRKIVFKDVPKNEDEWNTIYGIDQIVKFMDNVKIDMKKGAVVAGSSDLEKGGSIVARSNRVVRLIENAPYGLVTKTFDTDTTSGDTDYLEKSPEVAIGKIKFKAGELISTLPNKSIAGLLVDGKGNRIERADLQFAHNTLDPKFQDVRTMMGCITCHSPEGGFIPPRNMVEEDLIKRGIDVRIYDKEKYLQYKSFYLEWRNRINSFQSPYYYFSEQTGRSKASDLTQLYLTERDRYDSPLNLDQAALELCTDVDAVRLQFSRSVLSRLDVLVQGGTIPREAWEKTYFSEAVYLLNMQVIREKHK